MKNYIQNAVRTLFAGLFLMVGMMSAQVQSDAENESSGKVVVATIQDSVNTDSVKPAESDKILIYSHRLEANEARLKLDPCVYSLQSGHGIFFGAPEVGYNQATLTKLLGNGEVHPITHKRVSINSAEGQLNPIYNKKITHLSVAGDNLIHVVIDGKPDTVYRYSQFDQQKSATISSHKITNEQKASCAIKQLTSGILGGNEYVVAHVVSPDAPHEASLYFIKSYTKTYTIKVNKTEPQVAPAESDNDEEVPKSAESEAAKDKIVKTIIKYIFSGTDPLGGSDESAKVIPVHQLLNVESRAYATWDIADLQIRDNKLYLEMRNPLTDEHALLVSKLTSTKCTFTEVRKNFIYRKKPLMRTSPWQQEPSFVILTAGQSAKKYCIVVGNMQNTTGPNNAVLALPLDEKDKATPTIVGGESTLPGQISALQRTHETVYVAVTQSETKQAPGVFYSQAILDSNGSIAAWSSWQRAGCANEPVIGLYTNGFSLRVLSLHGENSLNFHVPKWRGPAIDAQEMQAEEKALKDRLEREANIKYRNEQLEKRRQEAQKKEREKGPIADTLQPAPYIASQPADIPDFNCISNTGFSSGYRCKNEYESQDLFLSRALTTLFATLPGAIHTLGNIPAATPGSASYLVAAGCKQVVISPTYPAYKDGSPVIRNYSEHILCNDGSLKASDVADENTALYVCKGGVLDELGFIKTVHCASNGQDQWLFIGGPRGVAVLATETGAGFGMHATCLNSELSFKKFGSYEWVCQIMSDDQFVYIVTEDRIDRIPLNIENFKTTTPKDICTVATAIDVGTVCDGYIINDACVSHGMLFVGTSRGLVATAPGIDCRTVADHTQITWQKVGLPTSSATISQLIPLSSTPHAYDVACKGQLYVVACSLFDDSSSVTRLFIDRDAEQRIALVPDTHKKQVGSWLNYSYRIGAFFTNGTIHLVSRDRFEDAQVDLALMDGSKKRNKGNSQLINFSETTARVSTIMRSSGSGTIFVTADDGVRIYE